MASALKFLLEPRLVPWHRMVALSSQLINSKVKCFTSTGSLPSLKARLRFKSLIFTHNPTLDPFGLLWFVVVVTC